MYNHFTNVFNSNIDAFSNGYDIICNEGGTSSSKTISIIQLLIEIAIRIQDPRPISIVSETFPHLEKGAIADFIAILGDRYDEKCHNKTKSYYMFGKSKIEFFSVDKPGKAAGPRRRILYINEANNISKDIYDQLDVRTDGTTFLDWNPVSPFWGHDLIEKPPPGMKLKYIHSTYKDNDQLSKRIIAKIESRKENKQWWRVYGQGKVGQLEGLIYPDIILIDEMPEHFKKERYGLDFGFTNHPSSLIHCGEIGDELYLDELVYSTGLVNISLDPDKPTLVKEFDRLGVSKNIKMLADCASPKDIEEIRQAGYAVYACDKKAGINHGIQKVQQYRKIYVTKRSLGTIKEFRNYLWLKDKKTGLYTNIAIDDWNHSMDAIRYAVTDMQKDGLQIFCC